MSNPRGTTALAAGAGLLLVLGLIVAVPLLLTTDEEDCAPSSAASLGDAAALTGAPAAVGRWSGTQLRNAAAVITVGRSIGVPARAQAIAVMTAMGESSLTVVDHGDAVGPDSRGLFQQRANGAWGNYTDRMSPTISATNFYKALLAVPGWEHLSPTLAAHRTQHNADPNHYTRFWADALHVTQALTGSPDAGLFESTALGGPTDCGEVFMAAAGGTVAYPLPAGTGYTDRRNWGSNSGPWARGHTGTDLSVGCGTPVLAATAGRVDVETGAAWSGRWLVKVATGTGQLTTWYAHMQTLRVADGQVVQAGQQLGEVGAEGNSSGCHLHFEVHPEGGTIYADNINPTGWLATHVGKPLPGSDIRLAAAQPTTGTTNPTTPGSATLPGKGFRLASFNVLGHSHTTGRGKNAALASGPARMRGTLRLLADYRVDVVGLQELQKPQWAALRSQAGNVYDVYPASTRTRVSVENSIIWRRTAFEFLRAGSVRIPYFNGNIKPMPVVLLRQRATGRTAWFVNVHNPADTNRFRNQGRWRTEAVRRERRLLLTLTRTGRPVFLTGDFNSRLAAYCQLTAGGLARASVGGQTTPTCRPRSKSIDWIFATGNAGFTAHRLDPRPRRDRISDHPIVMSNALIGP